EPWHSVVLLPEEILANPPSKDHGVDWETETQHRAWGCELIQEAGILLRLPQVVMCTGQTLLQRFYYRKSLTKFDAFSVAMGCVLLAAKLEEAIGHTRVRDVVMVFHRMYLRRRGLPLEFLELGGTVYAELKTEMIRVERYVLKDLGFGFYNIMDHPHKFILYYVRVLGWELEATQRVWSYLNDALRTDLCLRYRAEVIACAAIYMAARALRLRLPQSPPWWRLFNAELPEIGQICNAILALYKKPKVVWLEPLHSGSVFAPGGAVRRCDPVPLPGPKEVLLEAMDIADAAGAAGSDAAKERDAGAGTDGSTDSPGMPPPSQDTATQATTTGGTPLHDVRPVNSALSSPALPPRAQPSPTPVVRGSPSGAASP
ncbi:cyclin-like protein, partial [Tribonema minus]